MITKFSYPSFVFLHINCTYEIGSLDRNALILIHMWISLFFCSIMLFYVISDLYTLCEQVILFCSFYIIKFIREGAATFMDLDIIAAISTPVGEGAISIIRLSGEDAMPLDMKLF